MRLQSSSRGLFYVHFNCQSLRNPPVHSSYPEDEENKFNNEDDDDDESVQARPSLWGGLAANSEKFQAAWLAGLLARANDQESR